MPDGGRAALNVSDHRDARFLDPALDRLAIRPREPIARPDLARWYRARLSSEPLLRLNGEAPDVRSIPPEQAHRHALENHVDWRA